MDKEKLWLPFNARIHDDLDEFVGSGLYVYHLCKLSVQDAELSKEIIQLHCTTEDQSLWCTVFSFVLLALW